MIILIAGASHTGKTLLAQRMLEKYNCPYLSIDHLKMGLIRSGHTNLTPLSADEDLTNLLWPIVSEIMKTAIENEQNLIVEGCYIPFDWKNSFDDDYLDKIKYICLIMSEEYIENHLNDISGFANAIKRRLNDQVDIKELIADNKRNLALAKEHGLDYILIDKEYKVEI